MPIFFLSSKKNRHPIDRYLAYWGRIHTRDLIPLTYESFVKKSSFPKGLYVFSDFELLDGSIKDPVMDIFRTLSACPEDYQVFNHPEKSLKRFDLLQSLYQQGLNVFNVFRLQDDLTDVRFPVFLRKADDHLGPRSELLFTPQEIQEHIERLKARRECLDEWILTEFCDVSDEHGIFRKYSSFIVGSTIVPRHIFFSTRWVQKKDMAQDTHAHIQEELQFLRESWFQDQIQHIFQLAHITFGRIDFGVWKGKVQTWEINTNPLILAYAHVCPGPRLEAHQTFFKNFSSAVQTLIDRSCPPISPWTYFPDRTTSTVHRLYQRYRYSPLVSLVRINAWKKALARQ